MLLESNDDGIFITKNIVKRSFKECLKSIFNKSPVETIFINNNECTKLNSFLEIKLFNENETLEIDVDEENPYR